LCVARGDREPQGAVRAGLGAERAGDAAREVEAGKPAAGPTRRIRVVVDEVRLVGGCRITCIGRDAVVEAARTVGRELWDGDRGENADDRDHDQKLDEGESLRAVTVGCFVHHHSFLLELRVRLPRVCSGRATEKPTIYGHAGDPWYGAECPAPGQTLTAPA